MADFNRPSPVKIFERRTEGNCSFTTMRSCRSLTKTRGSIIGDGIAMLFGPVPTFRRSKEPVDGPFGFAEVVSRRTNRPNFTTNGYYSSWRGPPRPNRFSLALFDITREIDSSYHSEQPTPPIDPHTKEIKRDFTN